MSGAGEEARGADESQLRGGTSQSWIVWGEVEASSSWPVKKVWQASAAR